MLEGLQHLLELQRLDGEIARRQETLAAMPGKRKQLEESSAAAAAHLVAAREGHQAAEMQQRQAESALQDQEALLRKLEGQQFQVKDNTAYTALLSEMEHAKGAISTGETDILEGMEASEAANEALARAETGDRDASARQTSELRDLDTREEKLQGELAELNIERDAVGPKLDKTILAAYEKVAKRKSPALAMVRDETCEGCRVGIPAQNYIEILKAERIIICGNCNRILLHPDMLAAVESAADA